MPILDAVRHNAGDQYRIAFRVQLPNPYRTGGFGLTVGELGLAETARIEFVMIPGPQHGGFYEWMPGTQRMKAYFISGGNMIEVPDGTDLSAYILHGYAHGV